MDSPRDGKSRTHLNEVVGILFLALMVVSLLALLSYHGSDSTWFQRIPAGGTERNWMGRVGATLAEALLQIVGIAAFLVPLVLGAVGWQRFRGGSVAASYGRLLGYALLLPSLASVLDLLYRDIAIGGDTFAPGGIVGSLVAGLFRALLNRPGALVVSVALLAGSIILTSRFSFARTGDALAAVGASGMRKVGGLAVKTASGATTGVAARLRAFLEERRRRAQRLAVERKHQKKNSGRESAAGLAENSTAAAPAAERRAAIRIVPDEEPGAPRAAKPAALPRVMAPTNEPPKKAALAAPKQASLPLSAEDPGWSLPPLDLLREPEAHPIDDERELLERAQHLTEKFREFAVDGSVVAIHPGPVVTTFEFKPDAGVKYSKITGLVDDLCLALKAESVRIDRLPGRSTVGIEVPNRKQETIFPRELFSSDAFQSSRSKLTMALGKDIGGKVYTAELDRMPHLLIAGATGAGKSVGLNGMIASLLFRATPYDVRFIMIDTKMIELGMYQDIPHLLIPVVTDPKAASTALKWAVREMEIRYKRLAAVGVRNIEQFNTLLREEPGRTVRDEKSGGEVPLRHLPFLVIVIDEMADLMMVSSADVEESIMRLAQMARAVGIHLILATQRPSVDVITGTIKANFPSRIAFRVSQRVDSRTIIDQQGAEHLLGRGDMLFLPPGSARLVRVHGGYITDRRFPEEASEAGLRRIGPQGSRGGTGRRIRRRRP